MRKVGEEEEEEVMVVDDDKINKEFEEYRVARRNSITLSKV